ncbi:hypothetical protein UK23_38260 [Lentzea aerocolonigenes]|uniref:RING-type domain-containing protein n=1 Tax=Lentzea aerocolonigenes TaxID=68170 RepID=A0A0F0GF36_LENAE|nr:hypothetical protein [Lentzea aerocolonigenes]KJK42184.1 hypothetical protein UK23_38260 [Lentzea aerocolonigenes]
MTTPNYDMTCPICVEQRPVTAVDAQCTGRMCLPCLEMLVEQSTVPTAVATASDDEAEWGQLPAAPSCPFCRAELDRAVLAQLGVAAPLLDAAFSADRSAYYYRYVGDDWQAYVTRPFLDEAGSMPVLDPARLPVVYGDHLFMPGANEALAREVDDYNTALRAFYDAVTGATPPPAEDIERYVLYFGALATRITAWCERRAEVADLFLDASATPDTVAVAHREQFGAMRLVCMRFALVTEDQVPSVVALLRETPCVRLNVPDLRPHSHTLGPSTAWFDLATSVAELNEHLAEVWTALQDFGARWTPETDREPVFETLRAIDEAYAREAMEELESLLWCCAVVRQENSHLREQMNVVRELLGIEDVVAPLV